jgi:hypothetical protein
MVSVYLCITDMKNNKYHPKVYAPVPYRPAQWRKFFRGLVFICTADEALHLELKRPFLKEDDQLKE